jgi:hypothetical protein
MVMLRLVSDTPCSLLSLHAKYFTSFCALARHLFCSIRGSTSDRLATTSGAMALGSPALYDEVTGLLNVVEYFVVKKAKSNNSNTTAADVGVMLVVMLEKILGVMLEMMLGLMVVGWLVETWICMNLLQLISWCVIW